MNAEFVMTKDDIVEMKQKAKEAQNYGIKSGDLPPTSYEMRRILNTKVLSDHISEQDMQVDNSGWEPNDEFLDWLMNV